jgi:hypothetical protein
MTTRPIEEFKRRIMLARSSLRFVLVNEESPGADVYCAACCTRIDRGYARDPRTRLLYCDADCFAEHERLSNPALIGGTRRVS